MKIKNTLKILLLSLVAICLFSCKQDPIFSDTAPEIKGAIDQTIDKGTKFVPLTGVTATDKEDGDLTDQIKVDTDLNYNVVGTYTVTYTVYDQDGNKASVTITVTVVENDKDAPIISGVANKEIIVGEIFDPKEGVTAIDVIDGELTESLVVTGEVNTNVPGQYDLVYKVSDKAGNEASVKRTITVTLGYFTFEGNVIEGVEFVDGTLSTAVSSGAIDTRLEVFGLVKFSFTAEVTEKAMVNVQLGNELREIEVVPGVKEYTAYGRYYVELTDIPFIVTTSVALSNVTLQFGVAKDMVEPEIIVPENLSIVLPGNIADEKILIPFITSKLQATDNIDGVVTSKLQVNFGNLNLGTYVGTTDIEVSVVDSSDNKASVMIPVTFTNVYDTRFVQNPNFDTDDVSQFGLNGGGGKPVIYVENGEMVSHTTEAGAQGWDSASSPTLRSSTDVFKAGSWYLLKFDAYADRARKMTVRIGLDTTPELGYIENFQGASNYSTPLTTEKTTYYVIFYVHAEKSQTGKNGVSIELKIGTYDWNTSTEQMNPVHFDNMQFYLLSNENNAPEITPVAGKPTTFGKGQELPSFVDYVEAYDLEDGGTLTLTEANVDLSKVDVNNAGVYPVTITVTDTGGKSTSYTFEITILEEADTTAPVITVEPESITIKQNEYKSILECAKVTITDDVDGTISLANARLEGEYSLKEVGVYEVTIIVSDTSGNEARKTVTLTVTDGEAPVINCGEHIDFCVGDVTDPSKLITITDNVDGNISLADAVIEGDYSFTEPGVYNITITVSDKAGNSASKAIEIEVFPAMADQITVEDFESYENSDAINVEDGNIYRRWLPYGGTAQTLNDLELVVAEGNKAASFKYNAAGESIFVLKVDQKLPSKFLYLRFKLVAQAEKIRVWIYTDNGNFTVPEQKLANLHYDEAGFYYIEISKSGTDVTKINAVGISMNYQSMGDVAIIDEIGFATTCPETTKSDFVQSGEETTAIYDFVKAETPIDNGSTSAASVSYVDGVATINVTNVGTWASFAKMKMNLTELEYGKSYAVRITVKADQARQLKFNLGQGLWSEPWLERFTTSQDTITIGSEYETYTICFVYDKENRDGGPVLEFCFGQIGHEGDVAGNNIYIKEFIIIEHEYEEPLPEGAVKATITGNNKDGYADYQFSADFRTVTLQTIYTSATKWGRFDFAKVGQSFGKVVVTLKGTAGLQVGLKLDTTSPANNKYDGVTGNKQYLTFDEDNLVIEWDLKALNMDATLLEKLVFWAYAPEGTLSAASFKLISIVFYPAEEVVEPEPEPTPIEHAVTVTSTAAGSASMYQFSADYMEVTITGIPSSMTQWARWDFAALSSKTKTIKLTLKTTEGYGLSAKVDGNGNPYDGTAGNKQYKSTVEGELVFEWDLEALGIDPTKIVKVVFWAYDSDQSVTNAKFNLVAIQAIPAEEVVEPEPEPTPIENVVEITGSTAGNNNYTFSEDHKTVTINPVPSEMNPWARWNFAALSSKIKTVILTVKTTEGYAIAAKIDGDGNPYDGVAGNKQYKSTVEGELVFEWDLEALGIDPTKIVKVVFWAYDSDQSVTNAKFNLVAIQAIPAEEVVEPEPEPTPTATVVEISKGTIGNNNYTFSEDYKTVTVNPVPNGMSPWARWDFVALECGVTKVTLTLKTTEGYAIAAKIDGDGNPYDGVTGNKQYKSTVEGELVFEWDLTQMGMNPEKIIKLVFWVYDADQSVTSTSFELISIVAE